MGKLARGLGVPHQPSEIKHYRLRRHSGSSTSGVWYGVWGCGAFAVLAAILRVYSNQCCFLHWEVTLFTRTRTGRILKFSSRVRWMDIFMADNSRFQVELPRFLWRRASRGGGAADTIYHPVVHKNLACISAPRIVRPQHLSSLPAGVTTEQEIDPGLPRVQV